MKLYKLFLLVEIQGKYKVAYYNYEEERRITLDEEEIGNFNDKEIKYMYVEDDTLYIEIDIEGE